MSRKTTSIKGVAIDFDLFEVKRQIADKPKTTEAKEREQFVFSKRRRGSKRTINKMLKDQQENATSARDSLDAQHTTVTPAPPPVKPKTVAKNANTKRKIIKRDNK